jgi:hypothetical protein
MNRVAAMHPAAISADALLEQCDVERLRRSGPGGQHRNKVETAVRLCHRPTGVTAEAGRRRSQAENRAVAVRRLRIHLALEVRSPEGADRGPSPFWKARFPRGRIAISPAHDDFPAVLAEALDRIALDRGDVKRSADCFGCSPSQLIRLLKKEPRALARVNRWRREHGLGALR